MAKKRNPKGLGHYYKKNGLFCWNYTVDGEKIYRSSSTEKGLQEKVREIIGRPINKDNSKVFEWFEKWLEVYVKPLRKDATYQQYYYMWNSHIKPEIGKRQLKTIKPHDIQSVIATMNKNGKSTKTMKHAKTTMNVAFGKAVFEGILATNPVAGIEIPKKQTKAKKVLSLPELVKLYESMQDSRWLWSVKFALVTGLRRGELLALKWSDIEEKDKRIVVNKSNSTTGIGDTKSAKIRYVALSETAIKYLNKQLDMLFDEKNFITYRDNNKRFEPEEIKESNMLVFPGISGEEIKPDSYYHMIKRFAAKVGIDAHPHCLRHTFVYRMRHTLSLKELQTVIGHDKSTDTLDIYGDMLDETTDAVAKKIDDVFTNIELAIENKSVQEECEQTNVINLFDRKRHVK